jgi:hypothetical protein
VVQLQLLDLMISRQQSAYTVSPSFDRTRSGKSAAVRIWHGCQAVVMDRQFFRCRSERSRQVAAQREYY